MQILTRLKMVGACFMALAILAGANLHAAETPAENKKVAKAVTKLIKSHEAKKPFDKNFKTIVAMGPDAVPTLFSLAQDTKLPDHQRWTALRAVGQISEPTSIPRLQDFLKDPHPTMRIAAIRALGDMGVRAATPDLIELAQNDNALIVRCAAVEVLGQLKATEAIPAFEKSLDDDKNFLNGKSLFIRRHVVVALGQTESPAATPALIKALDDRDPALPPAAVESLQRITGLKFQAANQSGMNRQWKKWWQDEMRRIPQVPTAEKKVEG